jgi:hypothetical protein
VLFTNSEGVARVFQFKGAGAFGGLVWLVQRHHQLTVKAFEEHSVCTIFRKQRLLLLYPGTA